MTVTALRPNQPKHPLAGMTFYHGTDARNIPGILEQGILPKTSGPSGTLHGCLTTDLHCALFFGRLNALFDGSTSVDIAVITIPGESLDPSTLCVEWGSVHVSAYGKTQAHRTQEALCALGDDWQAVFAATDCLGVRHAIPVRADWVDRRFDAIPLDRKNMRAVFAESEQGFTVDPVLLARIAQEPRWMTSAPEHAERVA